jgi:hypothetical protein
MMCFLTFELHYLLWGPKHLMLLLEQTEPVISSAPIP